MSKVTNGRETTKREPDIGKAYLTPIPANNMIRARLHALLIDSGLDGFDFESHVLLSIILYGGKVTRTMVADDLNVSYHRVNQALENLQKNGLIRENSIHRPITYSLNFELQEFFKKLADKSIFYKLGPPEVGRDLLVRIHNNCLSNISQDLFDTEQEEVINLTVFLEYWDGLSKIANNLKYLFHLVHFALTLLRLDKNHTIILASLINSGGKISKQHLFNKISKTQSDKITQIDPIKLNHDLRVLGYVNEELKSTSKLIRDFYRDNVIEINFTSFSRFHSLLEEGNLHKFCRTATSGKRISKKSEIGEKQAKSVQVYTELILTLQEIANTLYQPTNEFYKRYNKELEILIHAKEFVRFIDPKIVNSDIHSLQGIIQRLEYDIHYGNELLVTFFGMINPDTFQAFLSNTLSTILRSPNNDLSLKFLVEVSFKELFLKTIKINLLKPSFLDSSINARGISPEDEVTFIPFNTPLTQDLENSLIFSYPGESSRLKVSDELSKDSPASFTTFDSIVEQEKRIFNEILSQYSTKTKKIEFLLRND
ncbi:MAG: hypothetical protein ACFFDC_17200 [Promethearchaeota archaeon]